MSLVSFVCTVHHCAHTRFCNLKLCPRTAEGSSSQAASAGESTGVPFTTKFMKLDLQHLGKRSAPAASGTIPIADDHDVACPLCEAVRGISKDFIYPEKDLVFIQGIDVYCRLAFGLRGAARKGLTWTATEICFFVVNYVCAYSLLWAPG